MKDVIDLLLNKVASSTNDAEKKVLIDLLETTIKNHKEVELAKAENQLFQSLSSTHSLYTVKNGASLDLDSGKNVFVAASGQGTKVTVGKTTMKTVVNPAANAKENSVDTDKPVATNPNRSSLLRANRKNSDDEE
jgi:hypothetical protein